MKRMISAAFGAGIGNGSEAVDEKGKGGRFNFGHYVPPVKGKKGYSIIIIRRKKTSIRSFVENLANCDKLVSGLGYPRRKFFP